MSDQAIATDALTKRYRGDVLAVDGVNLRVARGEIEWLVDGFIGHGCRLIARPIRESAMVNDAQFPYRMAQ